MPRLKTNDDLLGTCGAARYLDIHRSTLEWWRRRGEIEPTRIEQGPRGKLYRYSRDELDRLRERIDYDA